MGNLLRTLIFNDEVSLTIADTTEIVREGMRFHGLSPASAYFYGRGMSAMTYMSFNTEELDGVTMEVTLFVRQTDGKYERLDESHRQYCYSQEEIVSALEKNGFTLLGVEGHLGEDISTTDRILFIARKD